MSLATEHDGKIAILPEGWTDANDGGLATDYLRIVGEDEPRVESEGWDTYRRTWGIFDTRSTAHLRKFLDRYRSGIFYIGHRITDILGHANDPLYEAAINTTLPQLWCQSVKPRCHGGIWLFECEYKGLLAPRDPVLKYTAAGEQQYAENVTINGTPRDRALIMESAVGFSHQYIIDLTLSPPDDFDTDLVGTAVAGPTGAPSVRASGWVSLPDPLFHYPYGWVFENLQTEKLTGVGVHLATAHYRYQYPFSP